MAQTITGTITSTKMTNTVTVLVVSKMRHPVYKKVVTKHRKFKAHNEKFELKVGDTVEIQETKPYSKTVYFIVSKKI